MGTRRKIIHQLHPLLPVLLLWGLISSCAPPLSSLTPPENYKGPIAERPVHQGGDYWVHQRGDGTRAKFGTALLTNIEFPLWVGKTWSYQGQALPMGQPQESKAFRSPVRIDCDVAGFRQITVAAGNFEAFECKCQCTSLLPFTYDPNCGSWTLWYAPQAKNIVRKKTESTASSMELAEYKVSMQPFQAKPLTRPGLKVEQPAWKVGYQWRYAWKGPGTSGTITSEVVREDTFEGAPSYVRRTGKNETFYTKDILSELATMSSGRLASKYSPPYQVFSWPLEVGKEWRNTYTIENVEKKSSQNFDFRMVASGVEQITVPAGSFEALKIEVYGVSGGNLLMEYWYSPKTKWMVKSRTYLQAGEREEELVSFKVD